MNLLKGIGQTALQIGKSIAARILGLKLENVQNLNQLLHTQVPYKNYLFLMANKKIRDFFEIFEVSISPQKKIWIGT